MNQSNHLDYYVARAATSRDLARRAADRSIAAIHAELATRYDRLAAEIKRDTQRGRRAAHA